MSYSRIVNFIINNEYSYFAQKKKKVQFDRYETTELGHCKKYHNILKLRLDVFQVAYVCVLTCLAVLSCEARSAMTEVFLARISSEACSVVKARVTGTEVLAKII